MKPVFLLVFLGLTGCVFNSPRYNEQTIYVSPQHTPEARPVKKPVPVKKVKAPRKPVVKKKPTKAAVPVAPTPSAKTCPKFVLPEKKPAPTPPDLNDTAIGVTVPVEEVIAKYAKELKQHLENERVVLEAAHKRYLENCAQ
jgi:hypothetical protein